MSRIAIVITICILNFGCYSIHDGSESTVRFQNQYEINSPCKITQTLLKQNITLNNISGRWSSSNENCTDIFISNWAEIDRLSYKFILNIYPKNNNQTILNLNIQYREK